MEIDARNALKGIVQSVEPEAVNTEVVLGSMSPFSGEKQDLYDGEVAVAREVSTHDPGRKNSTRPARSGDCKDFVCRCG